MDLFDGKKHFSDFIETNPTLSNFTLSQTLKYMEEKDLVKKIKHENKRENTEYRLTEKSKNANKILYEMTTYALNELECSKLKDSKKEILLKKYSTILDIK